MTCSAGMTVPYSSCIGVCVVVHAESGHFRQESKHFHLFHPPSPVVSPLPEEFELQGFLALRPALRYYSS